MSIGLPTFSDPRILWDTFRMMAHLDGVTLFKPTLSHPFSDRAQHLVAPVVQGNSHYYSKQAPAIQLGAALGTSAFQSAVMVPAGLADMVGAVLTERPDRFIVGLFADTVNMVFSINTRTAKMTAQGVEGSSVFDRTLAVANLATEIALAGEGLKGMGRGAANLPTHLNRAAKAAAEFVDRHLTPAPAAALVDGGLMMVAEEGKGGALSPTPKQDLAANGGGKIIEAEVDKAAVARREELDAALVIPSPGLRSTALSGVLESLAQAGDWADFIYALEQGFEAVRGMNGKGMDARRSLASEMAAYLPTERAKIPDAAIRTKLREILAREMPAAGRDTQTMRLLEAAKDTLDGWDRVLRQNTPAPVLAVAPASASRGFWASIGAFLAGLFASGRSEQPNDSRCPSGFAYIPAGSFAMGSKTGGINERPVHKVELDAYCIARTATTNKAYWDETGKSPSPANLDAPQQPVVNVNWHESAAYCQAIGGSLPTEAQWEKAAKGPQELPFGTHSGKLKKKEANYGSIGTVDVGTYLPNGYGLYDMTGNVWEWSQDWYLAVAYDSHPAKNPTGPENGIYKVIRGGSWFSRDTDDLCVAGRNGIRPAERSHDVGFRCVVSPKDSK